MCKKLAERADCWLLLDVNNVFVSGFNHDFDPLDFLHRSMPNASCSSISPAIRIMARTRSIRMTKPVSDEVWALFAEAWRRFGTVSTMIERDDKFHLLRNCLPSSTMHVGLRPKFKDRSSCMRLAELQTKFQDAVLGSDHRTILDSISMADSTGQRGSGSTSKPIDETFRVSLRGLSRVAQRDRREGIRRARGSLCRSDLIPRSERTLVRTAVTRVHATSPALAGPPSMDRSRRV